MSKRLIIGLSIFFLLGCNSRVKNDKGKVEQTISGIFNTYTTGYDWNCETVKHELILNADSSYKYNIFCQYDSASNYTPLKDFGKWSINSDSTIQLQSDKKGNWTIKIISINNIRVFKQDDTILTYATELKRDTISK